MTDPDIFPDGDWEFTPEAGRTIVDGKTHYPALLRLSLNRQQALELIARLAGFACLDLKGQEDFGQFAFCGTIERLPID